MQPTGSSIMLIGRSWSCASI